MGGKIYALQALSFGWKHSPSMAHAILAAYLVERYPGSVVVIQYAGDVLVAGRCPDQVRDQAAATKTSLEHADWVVSPKSKLEPSLTTWWMGKVVGGGGGGAGWQHGESPPASPFNLLLAAPGNNRILRQGLAPHARKTPVGMQAGRGVLPFRAGAYRGLLLGPPAAKCTPPPPVWSLVVC